MMTLLIIAIILTLAYNAVLIVRNKGIPPSLSHSFYIFGGNPKGFIFYGYLVAMFFLLIIPMIEETPEQWEWLPFIALASLGFTGAAADFFDIKQTKTVHIVAASIAGLFSVLWAIVVGYWYLTVIFAIVSSIIACINQKSKIYWFEMGGFALVFLTLFLRLLT